MALSPEEIEKRFGVKVNEIKPAGGSTTTASPSASPLDRLINKVDNKKADSLGNLEFAGNKLASGFWSQMGRNVEALKGVATGEPAIYSIARLALPRDLVDGLLPKVVLDEEQAKKTGAPRELTRGKAMGLDMTENSAVSPENLSGMFSKTGPRKQLDPVTGKESFTPGVQPDGDFQRYTGTAAEFIGGGAALGPAGGVGTAKGVISAAGAGLGSELGGDVGEAVGGETGKKVGSLVGALAGGYANAVRYNTVKEVLQAPLGKLGDAKDAVTGAWKQKKEANARIARGEAIAGDEKTLTDLIGDRYSDIRATAKAAMDKRVQEQIAGILRMSPEAQARLLESDQAAISLGLKPEFFTLAERTQDPTLLALQQELHARGATPEIVARMEARHSEVKKQLADTVGKVLLKTKQDFGDVSLEGALAEANKSANMKLIGLEESRKGVLKWLSNLTDREAFQQGSLIRDAFDRAKGKAKEDFSGAYSRLLSKAKDADLDKGAVDLSQEVKSGKALLDSVHGRTSADIPTTYGEVIDALAAKKGVASFEDATSLVHTLGKEAAQIAGQNPAAAQTLKTLRDTILSKMGSGFDQQLIQEYLALQKRYATEFVPRFRTGVNSELGRTANRGLQKGEEAILNENVLDKYLPLTGERASPTKMKEFDDLFGGKIAGSERSPEAFEALTKQLETKYQKQVAGKDLSVEDLAKAHENFVNNHSSALDLIPNSRKKLDNVAEELARIKVESELVRSKWKAATDGSLESVLGEQATAAVLTRALADPAKMSKLIEVLDSATIKGKQLVGKQALIREIFAKANPYTDGKVDYSKFFEILNAGRRYKREHGSESSMDRLFKAAFGERDGKQLSKDLEDIALLMQREESSYPNWLRPREDLTGNPFTKTVGSSPEGVMAAGINIERGRSNALVEAARLLGRFGSARVQQALQDAQLKMIHDPAMAKAVLELAATKPDKAISEGAFRKIFGASDWASQLLKRLSDSGYILQGMGRNVILEQGVNATRQNEKDDQKKGLTPKQPGPGSVSDAGPGGFAEALAKYDEKYGKPFVKDLTPEQEKAQRDMIEGFFGGAGVIKAVGKSVAEKFAGVFRTEDLIKAADTPWKSRTKLVEMPIDDFLALAAKIPSDPVHTAISKSKMDNIRKAIEAKKPLADIPFLHFNTAMDKTTAQISGHEGRHRAMVLKELGYETMPVKLEGPIRWSEQVNPKLFDYAKTWPEKFKGEGNWVENTATGKMQRVEGDTIPFNLTREGGLAAVGKEAEAHVRAYHGTTKDFKNFKSKDGLYYFSKDPKVAAGGERGFVDPTDFKDFPEVAKQLTVPEGLNIRPVDLTIKRPATIEDVKKYAPDAKNMREAYKILKEKGFDGFVSDYEIVVFSAKQIKSAIGKK